MTPLRIAMLAPPWIPIPPPAYGGIEEVLRLLCDGLVERGHDVTLFAAPGSESAAEVRDVLEEPHPDEIEKARYEVDHVARAFAAIESAEGRPYDIVHDHTGYSALAMAERLAVPLVHTFHGEFDEDNRRFYAEHGHKARIVCISRSQCELGPPLERSDVVPNPLAVEEWPFSAEKEDFVLWIGRMAPVKGPQRAIEAARKAGVPLVVAGPVQPGQEEFFAEEVEPHFDDDGVRYVGEADGEAKRDLYRRARALLNPIRWSEPFGLVMVEAMACGTPVISFAEGAAREVVIDGENGFLVDDEQAMADAVGRLGELDPRRCRDTVEQRFGVPTVVEGYEAVYRRALSDALAAAP